MRDQSSVFEKGVEGECPKYSFISPEGFDSKYNLSILSSLLEANNGQSDISFDEQTCRYVTPIYRIEQKGDIVLLYTRGTHFDRRGLVVQTYPPQQTFLDTVWPIEISSPERITFVEEKDFDNEEALFEDLNMGFSLKEEDNKVLLTAFSKKTSLYDEFAPIEDIEMVQTEEGTLAFGLNQEGKLLGDHDKYLRLCEYVKNCTGPDGSLNGIRAKGVYLMLEGVETESERVQIAISV